jgi:hypothetical protein
MTAQTGDTARPASSSILFLGWMVIAGLIGASILPRLLDRPAATTIVHADPAPLSTASRQARNEAPSIRASE